MPGVSFARHGTTKDAGHQGHPREPAALDAEQTGRVHAERVIRRQPPKLDGPTGTRDLTARQDEIASFAGPR